MNAFSISDQLDMLSFVWRSMQQPWIPSQREGYCPSIIEIHGHGML